MDRQRGPDAGESGNYLVGALLVVGSVSASIALGLVLTKVAISVMLAALPSIHAVTEADSGAP